MNTADRDAQRLAYLEQTVRKALNMVSELIDMEPQHDWSTEECDRLGAIGDLLDVACAAERKDGG